MCPARLERLITGHPDAELTGLPPPGHSGVCTGTGVKYEPGRVTAASRRLRSVLGRGEAPDGLYITLHSPPEKWAV